MWRDVEGEEGINTIVTVCNRAPAKESDVLYGQSFGEKIFSSILWNLHNKKLYSNPPLWHPFETPSNSTAPFTFATQFRNRNNRKCKLFHGTTRNIWEWMGKKSHQSLSPTPMEPGFLYVCSTCRIGFPFFVCTLPFFYGRVIINQ